MARIIATARHRSRRKPNSPPPSPTSRRSHAWRPRASGGRRLYVGPPSLGEEVADRLTIRDLRVYLDVDAGTVRAVDGASFRVPEGGTVALVGESGSGKSVLAQAIMGILPRIAHIESGEILFRDPKAPGSVVDLSRLDALGAHMQRIRGDRISIIFQEPMTALSPLHTIGDQVGETLALPRCNMAPGGRLTPIREVLVTDEHLIATRENYTPPPEGTLLRVQHLTKRFGLRRRASGKKGEAEDIVAVDDVSFEVASGEC